ncbi:hypothetical protein CEE34_10535 [Candidatus Aerophobetes bacterium Ae_b3a]|nr:MAG: hypothetical protein CEE34_10535 [Candidatus Aerophobetes bacterium Ae_b3a]
MFSLAFDNPCTLFLAKHLAVFLIPFFNQSGQLQEVSPRNLRGEAERRQMFAGDETSFLKS